MAGRLHVDEVLAELTGDELAEWQAYYSIEPWGDDWRRSALVAMLIAETNRDPEVRSKPFDVEDFMPRMAKHDDDLVGDNTELPEDGEPEPDWMKWKAAFAGLAEAQK